MTIASFTSFWWLWLVIWILSPIFAFATAYLAQVLNYNNVLDNITYRDIIYRIFMIIIDGFLIIAVGFFLLFVLSIILIHI